MEIFIYDNIVQILAITALVSAITYYVGVRYQRRWRINAIASLGYTVSANPTKANRAHIHKLSPTIMKIPQLNFGEVSEQKGIVLWWTAVKKIDVFTITCWSFRRIDDQDINRKDKWWIGIHIDGFKHNQQSQLSNILLNSKPTPFFSTYNDTNMELIYKNPMIFFGSILDKLNTINSTVIGITNRSTTDAPTRRAR